MIHKEGFSDEERHMYVSLIHSNAVRGITELLEGMSSLEISFPNDQSQVVKTNQLVIRVYDNPLIL